MLLTVKFCYCCECKFFHPKTLLFTFKVGKSCLLFFLIYRSIDMSPYLSFTSHYRLSLGIILLIMWWQFNWYIRYFALKGLRKRANKSRYIREQSWNGWTGEYNHTRNFTGRRPSLANHTSHFASRSDWCGEVRSSRSDTVLTYVRTSHTHKNLALREARARLGIL